jgi:MFS family permease
MTSSPPARRRTLLTRPSRGRGRGREPAAPRQQIPREIRVIIAAAFVIAIGFGLVAPVLPQFAKSFDVGVTATSIIVSAFALTRLAFAPAGGWLVERLGERPVYITGLLIVAVSTAACAFAGSYWQLLGFRAVGGIGSTLFTVSAMGLIVRLAPASIRGRVSGAYATAFLLGSIGGPIIGGLLAGLGLRVPFLVYAGALLLACTVVFFQLKGSSLADREAAREAQQAPLTLRAALRDSAYRAALVSSFSNGWSSFGIRMALVPLFATAVLAAGPGIAGISLSFFAAGTALALTVSGRLADTVGRRPLVISGSLVNGAAMAAIGFSPTTAVFLGICVVGGIGTGLMNPAQQAAVSDVVGNGRSGGKVLAAFQMSADLGAILGPIVAGTIIDYLVVGSYSLAFVVTGVLAVVAALVWLGARETLPRAEGERGDQRSSGAPGHGDDDGRLADGLGADDQRDDARRP